MDVQVSVAAAACAVAYYNYVLLLHSSKGNKKRQKRRWWTTKIHQNRTKQSIEKMISELLYQPSGKFANFCPISSTDFEYLLTKISPFISKQDTQLRKAIPAKVRLAITLRYLATGESLKSLHFLFKVSTQSISRIIPDVCNALNEVLKDQIKLPSNAEEWLKIEKGFKRFPHCLGAIDGKHIVVQNPNNKTEYSNYKGAFSIILLTLIDSNFCFTFAEIENNGKLSDKNTLLCSNQLNLPKPSLLPSSNLEAPFVFLSNGTFPLNTNILQPYPGHNKINSPKHIFNEKLSSSRLVVENVFGILTSTFRIFKKPIALDLNKAALITMTCVLLHNFLRRSETSANIYTPKSAFDLLDDDGTIIQYGSWRENKNEQNAVKPLENVPCGRNFVANKVRDDFASYFCDMK